MCLTMDSLEEKQALSVELMASWYKFFYHDQFEDVTKSRDETGSAQTSIFEAVPDYLS